MTTSHKSVVIITAMWRRPEVFRMFAVGVTNLIEKTDTKINVVVSGSEGKISRNLAESYGFLYTEFPNRPISAKHNTALHIAREINPDYVLCLGSDDILSQELFILYEQHMHTGIDFIGLKDFYFYDIISRKASYWGGYTDRKRYGETCGAGRMISRRLLNQCGWVLWNNNINKGLDGSMSANLRGKNFTSAIISLKDNRVFAVGIKSRTNVTSFKKVNTLKPINANIITNKFPYLK